MRQTIVHEGGGLLKYEIREIVTFAQELASTGMGIIYENIGDPVAKGELIPEWMRDIISNEVLTNNDVYGYSPTKGLVETREFLAKHRSEETGNNLNPEDILFFNGLGDAISTIYYQLKPTVRILGPDPGYPTHASFESAHAHSPQNTYERYARDNWQPNFEDIYNKVKYNPTISGILLINPGNPTGLVYDRETLKKFVDIAKEFNLFLICDEVYAGLAFDQDSYVSLAAVNDTVPTMILRGMSKELPWPGSRCGWIEFYNTNHDPDFDAYKRAIEQAKASEVCSTTLPQAVLPKILSDKRYNKHLSDRRDAYHRRAHLAAEAFNKSKYFRVVEPKGAFYLPVTFTEEFLKEVPHLTPRSNEAAELLKAQLESNPNITTDKRFCLELLAATGICAVPLKSGFHASDEGFRMTVLEPNDEVFMSTVQAIIDAVARSK